MLICCNGQFTLVELIVVLVILAILAAMLVPALTGYIKRAREEKEYQTAATVYAAAQAVITDIYGREGSATSPLTQATTVVHGDQTIKYGENVWDLAGVDKNIVTAFSFNFDTTTYIITGGSVTIKNGTKTSTYTLTITNGQPVWTAATA